MSSCEFAVTLEYAQWLAAYGAFTAEQRLQLPGKCCSIYSYLVMIVSFAILPTDKIEPYLFSDLDDDDDKSLNMSFEQNGYESTKLIRSAPSIIYHIFFILLLTLLSVTFGRF